MNKRDYVSRRSGLLNDKNTYEKLNGDPTKKYKTQLVSIRIKFRDSGAISKEQYWQLYPTSEDMPKFQGLPQIQKQFGTPPRPIISGIGSLSTILLNFEPRLYLPKYPVPH